MEGNRLPEVKPLGLERDKQVGEMRGGFAQCPRPDDIRACEDEVCSTCSLRGYLPYSSDLNVAMRLVGKGWVFYMGRSWDKEHENEWNCRILVKGKVYEAFAANPTLAMCDAITRAWLEVQD